MPMELWIFVGLAAAGMTVAVVRRLSGSDRRDRARETKNVYPLW